MEREDSSGTDKPKFDHDDVIINPYQNQQIIRHKKFISHLGIAFIDLKYADKQFMQPVRTVLRKICGQINYGTLNGIFGPKKCGKTALLKCLSGRCNKGLDSETKLFVNPDIPTRVIYLENKIMNNIYLSLTVDETLQYSFRFRDPYIPYDQRKLIIKEIIKNMDLYESCNTCLMDCSLEEQVRTQVAMCLATVNKPNMIFMEEPFSELDNVGIENFVSLMKRLSRIYSIAVVFSTSQILDSDVLSIFDKLYVLSRGGLCVYEGSVEHMSLFLRESDVIISSKIQTPIERLIKIASKPNEITIQVANRVLSTRDDILHFAQKYGNLLENGIELEISEISMYNIWDLLHRSMIHKYRYYWKSLFMHYCILVSTMFLLMMTFEHGIGWPDSCYNKTDQQVHARLIILNNNVTISKTIGKDKHIVTIYGLHLIDENLKFLFVITVILTLFHLLTSVVGLNEEIIVASNEHRNGLINIHSFILVKNLADMIPPLINTISCCAITYFFQYYPSFSSNDNIGFIDEISSQVYWRFWSFFWSQFSSVACGQSLGLVISVVSITNERISRMILVVSCILLIVFSGYLIPLTSIDPLIAWFSQISFVRQSYELTLISLYGLGRCGDNQTIRTSFVLEEFGLDHYEHYWQDCIIVAGHYMFYCLVFGLILSSQVNKHLIRKRYISRPRTRSPNDQIFGNHNKSFEDDDPDTEWTSVNDLENIDNKSIQKNKF